jgi:hypothetical protein
VCGAFCSGVIGSIRFGTTAISRHVENLHFNPVKHGYVEQAVEWPYSPIRRFVREERVSTTLGTK